jgi:ABC-type nitrate/sulfonate/bicarbonate transport system substrate-binding protein
MRGSITGERQNRHPLIKTQQSLKMNSHGRALRLGFVPLTDCAPVVMAHELGLFRKHGLRIVLSRELGWATIRDKIIYGELDAAHAVAGLPVATTLGVGSIACDCVSALVLNLHGNAITLSNELWQRGVRDAATLREEVTHTRGRQTFTFGVVHSFSSHNFLLRNWLASAGIHPDRDVRIVVVPPPQMNANLKAGHLDGFCVGEPWNSMTVEARSGWVVATSAELSPGHPEKVLMVRREFAEKRADQHLALIAALIEACEYCDTREGRDEIAAILSRPEYVNVPAEVLRQGLNGPFDFGKDRLRSVSDFCVFHQSDANEPSADKAAWILQNIRVAGLCKDAAALSPALGRRVFRADIFEKALRLRNSTANHRSHETQPNPEPVHA